MRPAKPLLILALPALLTGCGGGGGSNATSQSATTATTEVSTAPGPKPAKQSMDKPQAKPTKASNPPLTDPGPLPNEGTAAVAPGVPTVKEGDNSIQVFGTEAPSTERVEVAKLIKGYLSAEAMGRWTAACAELSAAVRHQLKQSAKAAGLKTKGCAGTFAALLSHTPPKTLKDGAQIHVLSLRVKGNQAFVIYRNATGKAFNLPLNRESGQWKITAPLGIELAL